MGWFWAEKLPAVSVSNSIPSPSTLSPPPSCPMHRPNSATEFSSNYQPKTSSRPYPPAVSQPSNSPATKPESTPSTTRSLLNTLNPLNHIPLGLSNTRAEHQTTALPLSRERSTIPKGDGSGQLWEYPSPQQMYNAMLRKGASAADTPVDAVESMVAVHNFLNEGAWAEILEWERRSAAAAGGLAAAWARNRRGEDGCVHGAAAVAAQDEMATVWRARDEAVPPPELVRFMGRPGEMTPKATLLQAAGWAFPALFAREPPFDRHDWIVRRSLPGGQKTDVRYVIDYYEGADESDGTPVFYLDVRPALDSPQAFTSRLMRIGGELYWKGTGAGIREAEKERKERLREFS